MASDAAIKTQIERIDKQIASFLMNEGDSKQEWYASNTSKSGTEFVQALKNDTYLVQPGNAVKVISLHT